MHKEEGDKVEDELAQFLKEIRAELTSLNVQLKVAQGDSAVMEKILNMSECADKSEILPADQEFAHLTKYLGLSSSPRLLLDSPFTLVLVRRWMSHPDLRLGQDYGYTAQVPQLIPLPQDYSNLINSISSFTCPRSIGEESKTPSMCLVCGTVVCSHSYCCQAELDGQSVGACTNHANKCGCGIGLFLRVRECKVVMFSG